VYNDHSKELIMNIVKIVRLISGEEVIGYVEETETGVVIKEPAILLPTPEGKLMFAKWLPYADSKNGIPLKHKDIVFVINAQKDLEDHFVSVIVGGLLIPGKKIVEPVMGGNFKLTQ
jgi:hypothetical protein